MGNEERVTKNIIGMKMRGRRLTERKYSSMGSCNRNVEERMSDKKEINEFTGQKWEKTRWRRFWGENEREGVKDKERDRQGVTARALTGVTPGMDPSSSTGICELGEREQREP